MDDLNSGCFSWLPIKPIERGDASGHDAAGEAYLYRVYVVPGKTTGTLTLGLPMILILRLTHRSGQSELETR